METVQAVSPTPIRQQWACAHVPVRKSHTSSLAQVTGVVDVRAPADRTWDALLDVEARVGEIRGLKEATVYLREPNRVAAQWVVQVLTSQLRFSIVYDVDRSAGWCRYRLDPSRPNDLVSVEGAYQVLPVTGGTRVIYRSITDTGRQVPDFVRNWLATTSLAAQLVGIRNRAEAPR